MDASNFHEPTGRGEGTFTFFEVEGSFFNKTIPLLKVEGSIEKFENAIVI